MKKKIILFKIFCIITIFQANCLDINSIYVDQTGKNNAYKTINEGIQAAYENSINEVRVGPGVYYENIEITFKLKLIGSGPNFTTIDSSQNIEDVSKDAITVDVVDLPVLISGFTITSIADGIKLIANNVKFTVQNCIIVGCSNGIYLYRLKNPGITLINNTIFSNKANGIYFEIDCYKDNYCYDPGTSIIIGNIISNNGQYGIYHQCVEPQQLDYNNVSNNNSGNYNIRYINNGWIDFPAGPNDINVGPAFINENNGNFTLKSNSGCKDKGVYGASYNDPDGSRNDIGAYAGPNSALFWPYPVEGPTIKDLNVIPSSIPKGGKLSIKAKGQIRDN